ncbi:MAG: Panacea domain-containing protein [Treponemataceae bacterium]
MSEKTKIKIEKELTSKDVTLFIIYKCNQKCISLTQTKLQKLLYIVYGVYLVHYKTFLFIEEPLCLPNGPVFEASYKFIRNKSLFVKKAPIGFGENKNLDDIIDKVLDAFGCYNAKTLSNWSHRKGSAWYQVEKISDIWGLPIPLSLIHKEFLKIVSTD